MNAPFGPAPSPPGELAPAEVDIAEAATPVIAKAAGGLVLFAGVLVATAGAQLFTMGTFFGAFAVVPYAHVLLGVAQGALGLFVFRARAWAASVAAVLTGALFLLTGAWLVVSFTRGVFTLLALGNPLVMMIALALTFVAIKPCERATEARARLAAQGLSFGL
jgi:hypothetical protein